MAYFQLGGKDLTLRPGSQRIGPDNAADIRLPSGDPTAGAIVVVGADESVVIQRAASDSVVKVNGVQLGVEPSPLMHGDRVEVGGHELRFGDEKRTGSTQFLSSSAIAEVAAKARASAPAKPTTATGGRLVSLVDGREYTVKDTGVTIGRDPSADIVVAATEVSRRHVSIAPDANGYLLTDLSTNGVFVNGNRVSQQQVLGRGDVIRIGNEEFRFYADVARASATGAPAAAPGPRVSPAAAHVPIPPPLTAPAAPAPQAPPAPPPAPPRPAAPAASAPPSPAPAPRPAQPAPAPAPVAAGAGRPSTSRGPLAILEIMNEGPDKGRKLDVHGPLTNIGRGTHNDLVLSDESVSDSHAKLQKREAVWYIVDVGSTNGTYVGGKRVQGEQAIVGAPDLRFGNVKVAFRPAAAPVEPGGEKGTRVIAGVTAEDLKRAAAQKAATAPRPAAAPAAPAAPAEEKGGSPWIWIGLGLGILAALAYVLLGS